MLCDADMLLLVDRVASAKTIEIVWSEVTEALAGFGFDRVNYGFTHFRSGANYGGPGDVLFLTNHPSEVTRTFFEEGLFRHTPMFRWALENDGAMSWRWARVEQDAGRLSAQEERGLAAAEAAGKTAGYTIAFPGPSLRVRGAVSLCAEPGLDQHAVDEIWARDGQRIEFLCRVAHLNLSQMPVPSVQLTERQAEVLEWIADGKTLQDVCLLTELSLSAVDKHLARARERLGVETTAQAVAKMSFLNQMFVRAGAEG